MRWGLKESPASPSRGQGLGGNNTHAPFPMEADALGQATATAVAEEVHSLGEADLLPFHELLDAAMIDEALKAEKVRFNDRIDAPS